MVRSTRITVIAVGVVAAIAAIAATSLLEVTDYSSTFNVDATWYPESQQVIITYNDTASSTEYVALEVLGLAQTFHVTHESSSFVETVPFDDVPANGWRAHPVVFDVSHAVVGDIIIKTEIHAEDQMAPHVVYGRPG